jgi:hypothetical protein
MKPWQQGSWILMNQHIIQHLSNRGFYLLLIIAHTVLPRCAICLFLYFSLYMGQRCRQFERFYTFQFYNRLYKQFSSIQYAIRFSVEKFVLQLWVLRLLFVSQFHVRGLWSQVNNMQFVPELCTYKQQIVEHLHASNLG